MVHIRKVVSPSNNIKHESIKSVPEGGGANAGKKKEKVYRSVISALWKSERATRVNGAEA